MLFNSYIFILLFLPLALVLYFGLNRLGKEKAATFALTVMSFWFYAYFKMSYLFILLGSILFNYVFSRLVYEMKSVKLRRLFLAFGVISDIALIFYYKYYNFFCENLHAVFGINVTLLKVVMPLGISFFTFQQVSYLVDAYRGETKDYSFWEYMLFVVFFPQLIAGPIVLHDEMIPQFRDRSRKVFSSEMFAKGVWWFAIGLAKKVLLADSLGRGVDWAYNHIGSLGAWDTIMVSLIYILQLYFDFSGYCDMASGIASMFHLELPMNFNSPLKSLSIAEFWNRWHISLGRFMKKYIYFPLGGSRRGKARTRLNLFIIFLVSGIWHGANWTYIIWGMMNGAARVLYACFQKVWDGIPRGVRWFATFWFVAIAWIMFRAPSVEAALQMYGNLLKPWTFSLSGELLGQFDLLEFTYLEEHIGFLGRLKEAIPSLHMMVIAVTGFVIAIFTRNCFEKQFVPTVKNAIGTIILLVWSIVSLSGISVFLYFNF